jgi:hypothetical protein
MTNLEAENEKRRRIDRAERRLGIRDACNLASAQMLVELLLAHQVPARIETTHLLPGIDGSCVVSVPEELVHRARWIIPEAAFDEAELAYSATGKLEDR